jgi:hypothetical protein
MDAAVLQFGFKVVARTRDEALALMDDVALAVLDNVGGSSWVSNDDDVQKQHKPGLVFSDEHGYAYFGERTMQFTGPWTDMHGHIPQHDGFRVQSRSQSR